ncbi:MAG: hypothetical protein WBM02_04870 [bacterium]
MIKKTRVLSVTLSHFSPLGIIFTSQKGAYWYDITAAVLGSFLIPFSVNAICFSSIGLMTGQTVVLGVGLLLVAIPLIVRGRSTEISFLSATREIVGIPGKKSSLFFTDVDRLQLFLRQDKCSLAVIFKNDESIVLFDDYPLNLALRVAAHLGQLLEIPVTNHRGKSIRHAIDIDWTLPCRLPSGWFPLEYLLFSAAFSSGICMLLSTNFDNIFLFDVAPKWLFLPVLAFPAGQLLKNIHHSRGYFDAVKFLTFFFILCLGFILWSSIEPAITFLGLVPGAITLFFLINNYTERKKSGFWLLPGLSVILLSFGFSIFVSYHYHSFFLLDASVVSHIQITLGSENTVTLEYPSDIRLFLDAVQNSSLYRSGAELRSASLNAHIVRPAGRDYFIELYRECDGRIAVVGRLSCTWFNGSLFLATLNSVTADKLLMSIKGIWPPGN